MKIVIRNKAGIPKKYLRLLSWKLKRINNKFNKILYSEIHIKSEGNNPATYEGTLRLGITGHDIIISNKSQNIKNLTYSLVKKSQNRLSKINSKNRNYSR